MVAVASYARLRDPSAAEVAFAVADELQGVGVGTRLLEQLAARAAASGVERLVFDILPANHRMLAVVAGAGLPVSQRFIGGLVEATMRIEPTGAYLVEVDPRDHVAIEASLRRFMAPAGVAVYGASPRRGTIGGELFRNIVAAGFPGAVNPLNREGGEVAGIAGRTSLAGCLQRLVDLAVICVPPAVPDPFGGGRAGGGGALAVRGLGRVRRGRPGGRRAPGCAGSRTVRAPRGGPDRAPTASASPPAPQHLNATLPPAQPLTPGGVGFASQSSALGLAVARAGARCAVSASPDRLARQQGGHLLQLTCSSTGREDAATSVVALSIESFGSPRGSRASPARRPPASPQPRSRAEARRRAPRLLASHTAALASSDAAVDALSRQAGVLRTRTLSEFLDAAALLSSQPCARRIASRHRHERRWAWHSLC